MDDFDPRGQEALAKLEQDERRARRRTVLYSLVPVGMGVLLVLYTGQKVASATRELDDRSWHEGLLVTARAMNIEAMTKQPKRHPLEVAIYLWGLAARAL